MKQQINFRASALTVTQLSKLAERWGTSQTETVSIAIDRVYQQERMMNMKNWIERNYPKGFVFDAPHPDTGQLEKAEVTNHYLGSGFQARHVIGVIVRFADGVEEWIESGLLDEEPAQA